MGQAEYRDRVVQVDATKYMQYKKVMFSKPCHSQNSGCMPVQAVLTWTVAVCQFKVGLGTVAVCQFKVGLGTVAVCQFKVGLGTVAVCQSRGNPRTVAVCQFNIGFVTVCQYRLSSRTVGVFQSHLKYLIVILGQWLVSGPTPTSPAGCS